MLLISACVLVSLVFFYLRGFNTSSASALYPLGLSLLFIFMAVDALAVFGRFWRQKDIAERYRRLAMEDSMTGMNNRNAFQMHWSAMLEQPPEALAIIVFDVDNLKQINDQCGHQAGDSAISTCAQQIRLVFEGAGSCYRTGGDEFEEWGKCNGKNGIHSNFLRSSCKNGMDSIFIARNLSKLSLSGHGLVTVLW